MKNEGSGGFGQDTKAIRGDRAGEKRGGRCVEVGTSGSGWV